MTGTHLCCDPGTGNVMRGLPRVTIKSQHCITVLCHVHVTCSTKLSQQLSCLIVCTNVYNGLTIHFCLRCGLVNHVSRIIKIFTRPGSLRQLTAPVTQLLAEYRMKITGPLSYHLISLFIVERGRPVIQ